MILNVICDACGEASATHVIWHTRWKQECLCTDCHDQIDHETLHDCRYLVTDMRASVREIVAQNPDATTKRIVATLVERGAVPVFLPPFDTTVKDVLRDRDCFRAIKVEGSRAFRYEVVDGDE